MLCVVLFLLLSGMPFLVCGHEGELYGDNSDVISLNEHNIIFEFGVLPNEPG